MLRSVPKLTKTSRLPSVLGLALALVMCAAGLTLAQPGTDPATSCSGCTPADTRTHLRSTWYTAQSPTISSYTTSRQRMYNDIFVFSPNTLVCVYTGFTTPTPGGGTNPAPINCEHTIPQSYFAEAEPMKSDIHHLYPTHGSVNSARSNYPIRAVSDAEAETWYTSISNTYTTRTTAPTTNAALHSKLNSSGAGANSFEPRDDHKGDIARSIFYFYTVYPGTAGGVSGGDPTGITRVADPATLYQWHLQDPPSANEIFKNNRIAFHQRTRNFFIDYPTAVLQAWGDLIGTVTASISSTIPKTSFYRGESFTLPYSAAGAYTAGNVFTAQLSDPSGSFASPTVLGTLSATTSGSIACTIPAGLGAFGTGHLIRVISSTPSVTGSNSAAITITMDPPVSTIALGALGFTTIEQGSPFSVSYTTSGIFNAGNTFTVYIKATGFNTSAGDGIPVGNVTSTTSGSISCVIPGNLATGAAYRVRIVASNTGVANDILQGSESSTFAVTAPVPTTVTTADITDAPLNPGQPFEVNYSKTGNFAANNVFTAQLSDAAGSFASPIVIGSLASNADGIVNAVVPANTGAGTGYKVRVISSAPAATGTESAAFTINAPAVPVITTSSVTPTTITAGTSASVAYLTGGTFAGGNVFTAQLSDASGSFTSPTVIGTGASPITVTIPTATVGGTNYRIRVVGSAPATTGTDNGRDLTILANSTTNLPIVINKYHNAGTNLDFIELLVVKNDFDARGLIIKDFSSNMVNDNGGKFQFTTNALWSRLPAGTLIVLRANSNTANDVTVNENASDWNLDVGITNTTYFSLVISGQTIDIASNEIVMLKAAGSGAAGTAGSIHSIANGVGGGGTPGPSNLDQLTQPFLSIGTSTPAAPGASVIATNPTSSLNDYSGTAVSLVNGAPAFSTSTLGAYGYANNATNETYILALRAVSTGVEDALTLQQRVTVFPNPMNDYVNVQGSVNESATRAQGTLQLYDISGRVVAQWPVDRADGVLDERLNTSAVAAGMYFLRLELPTGTATWRLIKGN
jgi:endonuclease I